ncbi:MAG: hypothetical protein KY475_13915, partial [Planctomycetes bacterium]|nr:hypothetical protein [Planctomycetota bacterium]
FGFNYALKNQCPAAIPSRRNSGPAWAAAQYLHPPGRIALRRRRCPIIDSYSRNEENLAAVEIAQAIEVVGRNLRLWSVLYANPVAGAAIA